MGDSQPSELLRKLLGERGIVYEVDERNAITKWSTHFGAFVFFARQREDKLLVETTVAIEHSVILTPEQAIAATLGNGECEKLLLEIDRLKFQLSMKQDEIDRFLNNMNEMIDEEVQQRIAELDCV